MKIAVVTGVSYGLGKSIVNLLLKNKYKIYGISRTNPRIQEENFEWINTDLYQSDSITKILNKINENKIDLLINNAGTVILENSLEFTDQNFEKIFNLNFKVPIKMVSSLLPKLENALIVNISSTSDRFADKKYGLYCASKSALNIFFDAIGLENPSLKIINLLPSYMDTPLQHKLTKNEDFNWDLAMSTDKVSESLLYLINNQSNIDSGTRVMVVNNKTSDDTEDPEKLYCYNVDTDEFKKVK